MKTHTGQSTFIISAIPVSFFLLDLALEIAAPELQPHPFYHIGLVGIAATALFILLNRELSARHRAEERLRKQTEELEALVRQRSLEYANELHRERSVLEAMMEHTATMLVYLDPQMNFVRANSAYLRSSGHTREEVVGRNHFELFPNEENEQIFRTVRDSGIPMTYRAKPFEYADQPWRGTTYWDWTLTPVKDVAGAVSGLVFSLRDVTDEHLATKRGEQRFSRLNALIRFSEQSLRERTAERLFQAIADTAREITGARISIAANGGPAGTADIKASSRADGIPPCPENIPASMVAGGLFRRVIESDAPLRLTDRELKTHPLSRGLPPGHFPVRGLLAVRLGSTPSSCRGFIMVSDKCGGEFNAEDEVLLTQLAALGSLSLEYINARTEAERHAAELDAMFTSMMNAVVVYDRDGTVIRANPAAVHLTGLPLVGMKLQSIIERLEVRDETKDRVDFRDVPSARALQGDIAIDRRLAFRSADGHERIIRASSSPLRLDGTIRGAVTVWADETERERLNGQLESERAKLKAIIDNAPAGIVVMDDLGGVQMLNPAAHYLESVSFLRRTVEPPSTYQVCHEDGKPYHLQDLPFVRSALYGEIHRDIELQLLAPDGGHQHLLVNSAPIVAQTGRVNGSVGMLQDITRRKHNEEALREQHQEYRLLMEQASDGIIILDESGKIAAANSRACELSGYDRDELMRLEGGQLIPPEEMAAFVETLRRTTLEQGAIVEHRFRRKDGTMLHVETSARRMSEGRYQAIIRDVSDRKKREEEFARAVRPAAFDRLFTMLREFQHGEVTAVNLHRVALFARNLNLVSPTDDALRSRLEAAVHEYRTFTHEKLLGIASLLRTVEDVMAEKYSSLPDRVTGAEILSLADRLLGDTDKLLQTILRGIAAESGEDAAKRGALIADHAETLSQKIVDVTRSLNEWYTVAPVTVLRSVAESFRLNSAATIIEVVEESKSLNALIGSSILAEVLSLLVGNALDALAENPARRRLRPDRILLRLRRHEDRVRIEVEDNGPGIAPDVRERMFERGVSTKGPGHGEGLGYARDHLSVFNGELTYEDVPGGGARFVILLVRV